MRGADLLQAWGLCMAWPVRAPSHIPDPLYFFLLLLMYMMPTSYNLQVLTLRAPEHSSEHSIHSS